MRIQKKILNLKSWRDMAGVKLLDICSSGEFFKTIRAVSECVCTCRQGDVLFGGSEDITIPL